jgi:uncharacterized integral membrane protein
MENVLMIIAILALGAFVIGALITVLMMMWSYYD